MNQKIGIIDADLLDNGTRHPNLALMKISGYHKFTLGDHVELLASYNHINDYDKVYLSCVFTFTNIPIHINEYNNLIVGGSGISLRDAEEFKEDTPLIDEIEHHMPDYTLYDKYIEEKIATGVRKSYFDDYLYYSIGFTTRGCIRRCPFCINRNKTQIVAHSPLAEFIDKHRKYIYLWDDNILSYPKWREVIEALKATQKPFQFRQGMDIRVMTEEKAEVFSDCKYKGDYIFAFDNIADKKVVQEKLKLWKKYIKKTTKLYVFCAFDREDKWDEEFWKQDIIDVFERIKILMEHGCLSYIMRYESYKQSPYKALYITIARWCNQPQFYKKKSFREFCIANQEYHKTEGTYCSAYKSMKEFAKLFPNIANQYFDLKYESLNRYKKEK